MPPQQKNKRNPFGSIHEHTITRSGRKVKVWDVRKRYTDASGQKKAKTQRCYSYAEALAALGNMPARVVEEQDADDPRSHTLGELLRYFRKEYCRPAIFSGDQQLGGYRQRLVTIETYLDEYLEHFGDISLSSLTYEHLRQYATAVATTPVKPGWGQKSTGRLPSTATINRKLSYLRRVLNVGKQLRWITANPFTEGPALIKLSKEQPRTRVLTFEEEQRLLSWCVDERAHLRLIVILAIDTGMRKREIFLFERGHIDLDASIITLPPRITKALRERRIVITERLEDELRRYFKNRHFHPSAPIFYGQKDADRAFETACRLAGIEGLRFHDLRHTATTWMDEADLSQAQKQNMIGHADDRTHQRYHNMSSDIVTAIREKMRKFEERKAA